MLTVKSQGMSSSKCKEWNAMWEEEDQLQFAMQQLAIVPIPFHGCFSEFFQFPPTNYSDDQ